MAANPLKTDSELDQIMTDTLQHNYFGCLVADEHGLCLGVKGVASRRSSGIITAIMNEVKKFEPDSNSPVVVIENDEHVHCSPSFTLDGLGESGKSLIRNDWSLISERKTSVGVSLFLMFFEKDASYRTKFANLKDVPDDELATNETLRNHALKVMDALSNVVAHLDNNEQMYALLKTVGQSHRSRNIPKHAYHVLKDCILQLIKKSLMESESGCDSGSTKQHIEVWDMFLTVSLNVITDQFQTTT